MMNERALVVGGGGAAGNAWVIGVIAGLLDAGLDVTKSNLIVGTSAGATAAAQITAASPAELYADILSAAPPAPRAAEPPRAPARPAVNHLERTNAIIAAAKDADDMRRTMGRAAIEIALASPPASQANWRATVSSRLPSQEWPSQRLLITAVDAESGTPVTFDRDSGVELADAVAASCSSGGAYHIGEKWYIDGGYRTNADNADLAAGYARVIVLSPFGGRSRLPAEWRMHLSMQVEELRAGGSRVDAIFPDADALDAFGGNMMNLSARAPAARAGYNQGKAFVVTPLP